MIIFIWLISFLFSMLHLYNFQINHFKTFKQCLPNKNILLFEYHTIFLVFSQYFIPFFIICFTYARIGIHIYFDDSPSSITKNQELNKKKVLFNFLIVKFTTLVQFMIYLFFRWSKWCLLWFYYLWYVGFRSSSIIYSAFFLPA